MLRPLVAGHHNVYDGGEQPTQQQGDGRKLSEHISNADEETEEAEAHVVAGQETGEKKETKKHHQRNQGCPTFLVQP